MKIGFWLLIVLPSLYSVIIGLSKVDLFPLFSAAHIVVTIVGVGMFIAGFLGLNRPELPSQVGVNQK